MTCRAFTDRHRPFIARMRWSAVRGSTAGLVLCLTAACFARDAPPVPAQLVLLDGTRIAGPLLGISDREVRLGPADGTDAGRSVAFDELLALEIAGTEVAAAPSAVLEFANGDRLTVEVATTEGDQLNVRWQGSTLAVPLAELRGVLFRPLDADHGPAGLLFREAGADDLVRLTNDDHLAGRFVAISEQDLVLETEGHELSVPRNRITAVAFSPELIAAARPESTRQILETVGGSLTVHDLSRRDDGTWQARSLFGEPVVLPAGSVRRVLFAGDDTVFLSDLEPSSIEFTPYLTRTWPVRRDRAVTGEPLTVGGKRYAKGLGVHSRCRISYDLAGDFAALHAALGLSESAGEIGSVEFAVEVDGRELVRTGPVTSSDPPVPIENLDLTGAETLTLTVDFGRNGDIRDRANWCDVMLVRGRERPEP